MIINDQSLAGTVTLILSGYRALVKGVGGLPLRPALAKTVPKLRSLGDHHLGNPNSMDLFDENHLSDKNHLFDKYQLFDNLSKR